MCHGGTCYLPTGRRFGIAHCPLVTMLAAFAQSHIWHGAHLAALVAASAALLVGGRALDATTGTALAALSVVAAALVASPVLFNPFSFDKASVRRDARDVAAWLGLDGSRGALPRRPQPADRAVSPWAAQHLREATRVLASNEGAWRWARVAWELATYALLLWLALRTAAAPGAPWLVSLGAAFAAVPAAAYLLYSCLQAGRPHLDGVRRAACWAADAALSGSVLAVTALLSHSALLHSWQVGSLFGAAVRNHSCAVAQALGDDAKLHAE